MALRTPRSANKYNQFDISEDRSHDISAIPINESRDINQTNNPILMKAFGFESINELNEEDQMESKIEEACDNIFKFPPFKFVPRKNK